MKVFFSQFSAFSILPEYIGNYLPMIASLMKGTANMASEKLSEDSQPTAQQVNETSKILVITIAGAITKYDRPCEDGMGTLAVVRALRSAYADESIVGIVLKLDSPGGEARACYHVYEEIQNRNKPVIAFVEDMACSAAYYIASPADLIIANHTTAVVGSIGVMQHLIDYRKQMEALGVTEIEIYSSLSPRKNEDYKALLEGNLEPIRKTLDVLAEDFISNVEKGRGDKLKKERSEWSEGQTFFAEEALNIGLIDSIDSFSNIVNYFDQL